MAPSTAVAKVKGFVEGLNGWAKVIAVAFACGIFYNKMDNVEKLLTNIVEEHKLLANHETRITVLETLEAQETKGVK